MGHTESIRKLSTYLIRRVNINVFTHNQFGTRESIASVALARLCNDVWVSWLTDRLADVQYM